MKREAQPPTASQPRGMVDQREWSEEEKPMLNNVWPLQLVDLNDPTDEHLNFLFKILKHNGPMQRDLLFDFIFPEVSNRRHCRCLPAVQQL